MRFEEVCRDYTNRARLSVTFIFSNCSSVGARKAVRGPNSLLSWPALIKYSFAFIKMDRRYLASCFRIESNSARLFSVVFGYVILRSLSASRTMPETIKRAFCLSSAGTTYQGA